MPLRRKTRSQYHKVCKMVMRHEGTIKSEKMAEALLNGVSYSFWRDVKKFRRRKAYFPSMVDGVVGLHVCMDLTVLVLKMLIKPSVS